jgi:hypothetical protein
VRLYTRNGYDFTARYPKIVDAVASLPVRSCVIDGEAIVVDETGLSVFHLFASSGMAVASANTRIPTAKAISPRPMMIPEAMRRSGPLRHFIPTHRAFGKVNGRDTSVAR